MTALPRNPVELPVKPLQSHQAATGRPGSNRSQLPVGAEGEGNVPVSFSTLVGKMARPENSTQPNLSELEGIQVASLNPEGNTHPTLESVQIGLEQSISPVVTIRTAELASPNDQDLQRAITSAAVPGQPVIEPQTARTNTEPVLPAKPDASAKAQPQGNQAAVLDPKNAQLPAEQRTILATDGQPAPKPAAAGGEPAPAGDKAVLPTQVKVEQAATARTDLSASRPDTGAPERRRPEPPVAPLPARATAPAPVPSVPPEATMRAVVPQVQAAPVPAEAMGAPVQQIDSASVNQTALAQATPAASSGLDDLPRLQDVRVLSTRVIELPPAASERAGQNSTVKVIDLQLQPDTLGRISAQLKRTGEGLEIRLEPSVAETALMLKEDRLALQRILGSLGSATEPTIVRIVEPVVEQKQTEGQEALTDHGLGEAAQGGDWSNTFEDLNDERRAGGEYQDGQMDDAEDAAPGGARRTGDIYI